MLTNNNPVPMNIGTISVNNQDFTLAGTCVGTASIAAQGSCELDVSFKSSQGKNESAIITIPNNAAGAPHHVRLSGAR